MTDSSLKEMVLDEMVGALHAGSDGCGAGEGEDDAVMPSKELCSSASKSPAGECWVVSWVLVPAALLLLLLKISCQ